MERRDAVGAVVLGQDGRVLVIRRGRAPGRGDWTLPGGKVEPGESASDAVVREVLEETGIRVRALELLTVVNLDVQDGGASFSYAIHEHLCEPAESVATPCPGDDAAEARWVLPAELESFGVSPAARSVVSLGVTRARARPGSG